MDYKNKGVKDYLDRFEKLIEQNDKKIINEAELLYSTYFEDGSI